VPSDRFDKDGLLEEALSPKPSYYTFKLMIKKLSGFSSVEQLDEGRFKFTFRDKNPVFVLWDEAGWRALDLSHLINSEKVLITYIIEEPGQARPETKILSSREIPVSESPVFVELVVQ